MIKKIIFVFSLLAFVQLNSQSQVDNLSGTRWRLEKLENLESGNVVFAKKGYFISFQNGKFRYSLEKNSCGGSYTIIDEENVKIRSVSCTRICCDGDISGMIGYGGEVKIDLQFNKLILTTNRTIYTFSKIKY